MEFLIYLAKAAGYLIAGVFGFWFYLTIVIVIVLGVSTVLDYLQGIRK